MSMPIAVDPELMPALAIFPSPQLSIADLRAGLGALHAKAPMPAPQPTQVETHIVPGDAVRVLLYRPIGIDKALPAILHIHGGGYIAGKADYSDTENRLLAAELGCVIVSVDYRLAPETRHPGPIEDCFAALRWMHGHAELFGIDTARVGLKGESAGGGLAAAVALMARDRGGPHLAFQHLIFPMLDDRTCIDADLHPFAGQHVWTPALNALGWSSLLGMPPGSHGVSSYAAPARAETLAGLPPSFIAVGALDLFLDENLSYARRLSRAGVQVELHVYPGAFHGFQLATAARVSQAAIRDSRAALRRFLHG